MRSGLVQILRDTGEATDRVCDLSLEQTQSARERMKGLLGRKNLPQGRGLWIAPCNSVHTFFMGFDLDLLYLDAEHRIIRTQSALKPWRASFCWPARAVIELAGGEVDRLGIAHGDWVQWSETKQGIDGIACGAGLE